MVRERTYVASPAELLEMYLQHVATSLVGAPPVGRRAASDEIVIVLPERADVVERRGENGATEITLRIRTAP